VCKVSQEEARSALAWGSLPGECSNCGEAGCPTCTLRAIAENHGHEGGRSGRKKQYLVRQQRLRLVG